MAFNSSRFSGNSFNAGHFDGIKFDKAAGASPVAYNWSANGATLEAIESSMVSYWKMEDLADSKGSHALTNNGAISFANDGKYNKCATFAGTGQYFSATDSSDFALNGKVFWQSVWMKLTDYTASGDINIISNYNAGTQDGWALYYQGVTDRVLFVTYLNNSGTIIVATGGSAISDNNYHHIMLIDDGVNIKIYVDNVEQGTASTATITDSATGIKIGEGGALQLDEISMGFKALTTDERTALYNGGAGAFYTG